MCTKNIAILNFLLFYQCLNAGVFPYICKIAKVLPFYKTGKRTEPNSFRPITLLSTFSKIFEKIIHIRMIKFISKCKLLVPEQFEFRRRCSCVHAITSAIEIVSHCIDDKKSGLAGFVDLKNAFDTIDHSILLTKLDLYGFRGITNTFLQSYLTSRKQYVSFYGKNSQLKTITFGVPHGSVLGPLLFLLYINDMPKKVTKSSICLFADDTCKNNSIDKKFNQDLKWIENWCTNKTNYQY